MLARSAGWHGLGLLGWRKDLFRKTKPRTYGDMGCICAEEELEK
jgi:hypothetical protein